MRIMSGSCCCCFPSETYGRNGVTQIFRCFQRTACSTTGGRSRWNILMYIYIYIYIYIILSTTVSFLDLTDAILLLQCLMSNVLSNDRAVPTDTNPKNLELVPPQSVTATRLD